MALYECVFIARQDISSTQVEGLTEQFETVITEAGGSIAKRESWGLRTMAYKIKKNRKGHYVLMNIDAPHAAVTEMERHARLNEDIIRFMTIRVEEHEEGQSVVLRSKADKDRRPSRGDDRRPPRGDDRRPPRDDKRETRS